MKRLVVAMTGASGAILGIRLLEALKGTGTETHLILSAWARRTIELETCYTPDEVCGLANACYEEDDMAAKVSSGSFPVDGMVIAPCSMKTLAAVAAGFSYSLIPRCADVAIKERRKLVLLTRETPLSAIHLENMLKLSRLGAVILPPCVGFYTKPETVEDVVNHLVGKTLDALGIENSLYVRWSGGDSRRRTVPEVKGSGL